MRFVFLNQYAPPDPSPTARLMGELADHLRSRGHEVEIVSQTLAYQGHHVRAGSRLRREVGAMFAMLRGGWRATRRRPDLLVALSSPPCLLVAAALLARLRGVRLAHWAMDLYPELAVVLGEVSARSPLTAVLRRIMGGSYRRCALIVTLDDDMAAHLQRAYRVVSRVLAPWPPAAAAGPGTEMPPAARLAAGHWTWLYSGNLGRAHEWRPMLDVQADLEHRALPIQLVFEGSGPHWQTAREYAATLGLRQCHWTPYVSEAESFQSVAASRLIIATQKRSALGLLWPSKLARVIPLDKPMLWIGPTDGAVARSLARRPDTACFEPDDTTRIIDWIKKLYRSSETAPAPVLDLGTVAARYEAIRREGCQQWEKWLLAAAGG